MRAAGSRDRVVALGLALLLLAAGLGGASAARWRCGHCRARPHGPLAVRARDACRSTAAARSPGSVSLRVRALPPTHGAADGHDARARGRARAGGDAAARRFAAALGPALRARQLVTFDQRGTGGSGRLACRALVARRRGSSREVGRCADELGPARVAYTTAESVADVEAVRAALGVDRLIALRHLLRHEGRARLRGRLPAARRAARARLGRAADRGRPVRAHDGRLDPARPARALRRRLPLHARSRPPSSRRSCGGSSGGRCAAPCSTARGHVQRAAVDERRPARPAARRRPRPRRCARRCPAAVHAALHGDPRAAAAAARDRRRHATAPRRERTDSDAVFIATTCEDGGVPWAPGTPLAAAPRRRRRGRGGDAPAAPSRRSTATPCARSAPPTCAAPGPRRRSRSRSRRCPPTPTLILSGDEDLRTPRADAIALAARLPGAQLLEVPDAGPQRARRRSDRLRRSAPSRPSSTASSPAAAALTRARCRRSRRRRRRLTALRTAARSAGAWWGGRSARSW